jgi:hypothetical protein
MRDIEALLNSLLNFDRPTLIAILSAEAETAAKLAASVPVPARETKQAIDSLISTRRWILRQRSKVICQLRIHRSPSPLPPSC